MCTVDVLSHNAVYIKCMWHSKVQKNRVKELISKGVKTPPFSLWSLIFSGILKSYLMSDSTGIVSFSIKWEMCGILTTKKYYAIKNSIKCILCTEYVV